MNLLCNHTSLTSMFHCSQAHIVISRPYLSTQLPEGPVDAPTLGGDDITITRT